MTGSYFVCAFNTVFKKFPLRVRGHGSLFFQRTKHFGTSPKKFSNIKGEITNPEKMNAHLKDNLNCLQMCFIAVYQTSAENLSEQQKTASSVKLYNMNIYEYLQRSDKTFKPLTV